MKKSDKIIISKCKICGRNYKKYVKGLKNHPKSSARRSRSVTCSKKCSRINTDKHKYGKWDK